MGALDRLPHLLPYVALPLALSPPFSALFSTLKSTRDSARKNSARGAQRRSGSGSRRNADCGGERARARVNCGCGGRARDSVLCDRHRRHLHVQHWMGHRRFVSTWWREAEEREGKQRGRQGREKRVRGREKREKAREEGKQRGREGEGRRECKARTGRESKRSEYTNENVALSFFLACACVCVRVRACVCVQDRRRGHDLLGTAGARVHGEPYHVRFGGTSARAKQVVPVLTDDARVHR